jgi:hypothetical protein
MAGRDKHFPGQNFSRFRVFLKNKKGENQFWSKIISFFHELIQGLTSKAQQGKYLKVIFSVLAGVNDASDQKLLNMRRTIFFGQGRLLDAALQRQFRLYIPFLGIARPQIQFPHSCVCEQFIYSQDQSTYFIQQNRQTHRGNI